MKNSGKKDRAYAEMDESFVSPKLSKTERLKAEQEFAEFRRSSESKKSDEERHFSIILHLKFQMEDYIKSDKLDQHLTFGYFLRSYIETIGKKNNEFAEEIDIKSRKNCLERLR
jgi:hypothetical protein